jgi:hypothetical protein
MQIRKIAIAVSFIFGAAVAQAAQPVGSAAIGGVAVGGKIGGTVFVQQGGTSESQSNSVAQANATLTTTVSQSAGSLAANVSGVTSTSLQQSAWNYSTGGGTGTASTAGYAAAGAAGAVAIEGVGAAGGYSGAGSAGSVNVTTNGGGYNNSVTSTNFGSGLTVVTQPTSTNGVAGQSVTVTDTKSGDAFASNSKGDVTLNTGTTANPVSTDLGGGTNTVVSGGVYGAGSQALAVTTNTAGNADLAVSSGAPIVIQTAVSNGL